jgi:hypothetical protein
VCLCAARQLYADPASAPLLQPLVKPFFLTNLQDATRVTLGLDFPEYSKEAVKLGEDTDGLWPGLEGGQ